jgi:hypothetical protein
MFLKYIVVVTCLYYLGQVSCALIARVGRSSGEEERDRHEPEPVPSSIEAQAALKTVKSFFMCTTLVSMMNGIY